MFTIVLDGAGVMLCFFLIALTCDKVCLGMFVVICVLVGVIIYFVLDAGGWS